MTGCTRETARCANARDYAHELAHCCREHVIGIMADLVPMLEAAKITYWADYGTLLGAVRNPATTWANYPWLPQEGRATKGPAPGIIPHDKDADICLPWSEWIKCLRLRHKMARKRYNVHVNYHRGSMKMRLSAANHTNVDMFFWKERKDGTMFRTGYAQVDRFKGKEFHKDMLYPLSTVEWEGMTLPAPKDPEAFLEMRYGPNWRVPVMANNDGVLR